MKEGLSDGYGPMSKTLSVEQVHEMFLEIHSS